MTTTVHLDQRLLTSGVYRLGTLQTMADSEVVYYRDGKTATVSLAQLPVGWLSLSTNGKSDASIQMKSGELYASDEITMTLLGSLAVAYRPDAKRAAVVGMGSGMTTHTLLSKIDIDVVDTIEIEPAIVEASRQYGDFVRFGAHRPAQPDPY